jgi:hypothetical protein
VAPEARQNLCSCLHLLLRSSVSCPYPVDLVLGFKNINSPISLPRLWHCPRAKLNTAYLSLNHLRPPLCFLPTIKDDPVQISPVLQPSHHLNQALLEWQGPRSTRNNLLTLSEFLNLLFEERLVPVSRHLRIMVTCKNFGILCSLGVLLFKKFIQ